VNLPPVMPEPKPAGDLELRLVHCFPMAAQLWLRDRGITTLGATVRRAEQQPGATQREQLVAAIHIDETVAGWAADAILDHLNPGRAPVWPRPEPEPEAPMEKIEYVKPQSLELHPDADLVPEMTAAEYAALLADVKARLVIDEPLKRIKGTRTIVDGRHRRRVAIEVGLALVPVLDVELGAEEALAYMVRAADLRRHLDADQRAALGAEYLERLKEKAKERQREGGRKGGAVAGNGRAKDESRVVADRPQPNPAPKSRDQAAALARSTPKKVTAAAQVKAKNPEAFAKVKAGTLSLKDAKRTIEPPNPAAEKEQQAPAKPAPDALAPVSVLRLGRRVC
jgi:hypothetical protein